MRKWRPYCNYDRRNYCRWTYPTILSYANQYTKPFNEISGVVTELQNAIACGAKIFSLINQEKEIDVEESENQFRNIEAGRVDINDVDFSYVPDRKLIENLNLHVKPGQKFTIVWTDRLWKNYNHKSFDEIL